MIDLALSLNILTTAAVVVGVIFGLVQMHQAAQSRRNQAAADVIRTVQTQEVRRAAARVLALSDDVDPEIVRGDPALLEAALAVDSACEMWGSMVFEGVVDHRMLDRMVGGWVRDSWRRLHRWVESERIAKRNANIGEWWQWLYEVLEADPEPSKAQGAYVTYRGRRSR